MKRLFVAAAGLVAAACASPPATVTETPSPTGGAERAYVTNQESGSVSVIDVESAQVIETVDLTTLGFESHAQPHHTVVSPDGAYWFVSLIMGGQVLKFDADNQLMGQAAFQAPGMLSYDETNDLLYVGRSMMAVNPPQRIGVIDPEGMEIEELDVFIPRPHALLANGEAGVVYSGSLGENRIAELDGVSADLSLVDVPGAPHTLVQFALSPDRQRLVATTQLTGKLLVFDATRAELPLLTQVDIGGQPWHPVFLPDGSRVYMGALEADEVVVVETEGWTVVDRITAPGIAQPHGSAVTADGRYVFVSNRNRDGTYTPTRAVDDPAEVGTVVKIDTATNQVVATIEVGEYPTGISIGPTG